MTTDKSQTTVRMAKIARLTEQAEALLRAGDAEIVSGSRAEGKRLLRACRRKRREVQMLKDAKV